MTLTYSRGGVLVGGVAAVLWIALGRPRVESAAALLLGGGAGLGVAVWAFSRPGLADDGQSHAVRVHDGAWFAVVFVLAALVVGALAYLGSVVEERRPLSDPRRRLLGRVALGALVVGVAAGAVGVVVETKPEGWFKEFTAQPTNAGAQEGPGRLATVNSSSRWLWWKEAWHAFEDQPGRGTGAGTFELTHRLLRMNNIVVTEPHNVPLQFLSETGIVGFLLLLAFLATAGLGVVRAVRRLGDVERAAGVALVIVLVTYLLHSLVDFDWDFVAVSGPFFSSPWACCWTRSRAGGAATVARAAAGCGCRGARALASDAVVRAAGHRCRDRLARRREAGSGVPARAGRALAQPARARADLLASARLGAAG